MIGPGNARVVAAARALVGCRFRLHGRDGVHGVDCVGLAVLALRAGGFRGAVPSGYAMRRGDAGRVCADVDAAGLMRVAANMPGAPGDLLLLRIHAGQVHFAIATGDGMIHADAMARRVVERPGPGRWPIVARWRLCDGTSTPD